MGAAFVVGASGAIVYFREPTEVLTAEGLAAARTRWRNAVVGAYELQYRMHGSQYHLRVRQGRVEELTVNGALPTSADWNAYSVEGLFDTLAAELDNLADPAGPFAGRTQTVFMRVRFHRELGYVERYLRSAAGFGRGATLESVRLRRIE